MIRLFLILALFLIEPDTTKVKKVEKYNYEQLQKKMKEQVSESQKIDTTKRKIK